MEDIECPYCSNSNAYIFVDYAICAKACCPDCNRAFLLQWNVDKLKWELQSPYDTVFMI